MKKKRSLIVVAVVLALLAAAIGIGCLMSNQEDYGEFVLLSTPLGDLTFTQKWEDRMHVAQIDVDTGYAAEISAKVSDEAVPLYRLYFGTQTDAGLLLGYVRDMEIRVDVLAVKPGNQWNNADVDVLNTIQEDLNGIIDQIVNMDGFRTEAPEDPEAEEDLGEYVLLDTPIGALLFPGRWKNQIVVRDLEVGEGYAAEIHAKTGSGTVKVYAVYIGTRDTSGSLIGYVHDVSVRCLQFDAAFDDSWTDADIDAVYTIQEELDGLSAQVMQMEGFQQELPLEEEEDTGEYVFLNTPVGALYCPQKWQDAVIAEEIPMEEGYGANIFLQTETGRAKLYEIYIGIESDIGYLIGYVDQVPVWINLPDLETDIQWTDADIDAIYSAQEDLGCLIDQFTAMAGFVAA